MVKIAIDPDRCMRDGMCATVCGIYVQKHKATIPEVLGEERCISCGHCVAICPATAISHSAFPPDSISPIEFERMPSPEQVTELLRARRSIRAFRARPLEKEVVERIIDGARFAPSGHNSQSTEYLVVRERAVLSQVSAVTVEYLQFETRRLKNPLFRTLASAADRELVRAGIKEIATLQRVIRRFEEGEDPILRHAPALLVFHARRSVGLADVNAQLALQNASLLAHAMGVGHFFTGYVMLVCRAPMARGWSRRIPDLLGIPAENNMHGALALGYPIPAYKNWIERKPARIRWV